MRSKRKQTRGYPVAILLGLEDNTAFLWQVFSKAVKPLSVFRLEGGRTNSKDLYNFHEAIINAMRPTFRQGVRSVIIASPPRTAFYTDFVSHVTKHHTWLTQGEKKTTIAETIGSAGSPSEVALLANSSAFRELIRETTVEESGGLLEVIEKRLGTSSRENMVLFSLEEAENLILYSPKASTRRAEYVILTDKFLANSQHKNRLNRLLQIASNKKIKTKVVDSESPTGVRITQLGGFVCLAKG